MMELARQSQLSPAEVDSLIAFAISEGGIDYAYDTMRRLRSQAEELRREYRTLRAYTDGLEHALRHGMHVEVNVEGGGAYADRSTESTDG